MGNRTHLCAFGSLSSTVRSLGFIFVALVVALGLSACGSSGGGGGPRNAGDNSAPLPDLPKLKTNPELFQVNCKDQESCLPYAGALLVFDKEGGRRCTFFLVESDVIATNDHCLGTGVKKVEQAFVRFPASGPYPDESVRVQSLISRSNDSHLEGDKVRYDALDFAYLKLVRKVNRPVPRIQRGEMQKAMYGVLRMTAKFPGSKDPEDELKLELQLLKCRLLKNSILKEKAHDPDDQTLIFNDCPIIQGDSGSAIIDLSDRYTVVGQVNRESQVSSFIQLFLSALPEMSSVYDKTRFDYSGELAFGNNYLCVPPHGKAVGTRMPQCRRMPPLRPNLSLFNQKIMDWVIQESAQFNRSLREKDEDRFGYILVTDWFQGQLMAEIQPYCYYDSFPARVRTAGVVQINMTAPRPKVPMFINGDLEPVIEADEVDSNDERVYLSTQLNNGILTVRQVFEDRGITKFHNVSQSCRFEGGN